MKSLFDLSGKIALVTGATKGIGRGIADRLAEHGARVIVSSRDAKACDEAAEEISEKHGHGKDIAIGLACDLDKLDDVERLAEQASAHWGGLDILVCNAAILPFMGVSADTPTELFDRILTSNQHHNFRLCQAVRGAMSKRGGGSIVLIGSIAGHLASPEVMAYAIAKAGVAHMARCLADEFAAESIRVNCVSPGLIRSYSSRHLWQDEALLSNITSTIPLRRIGEPDDVAGAVIFLSSTAGSYLTGAMIPVDGGRTHLSAPNANTAIMDATDSGKTFN